jgi:hypothetical protein
MRPSVLLVLAASLVLAGCGGSDPGGVEPPANAAPVAEAGPDRAVETGALVTLDGSASSDADGDALGHAWTFVAVPAGSAAALSGAATAAPTFTADVDGAYVVQLVVADGAAESAPDTVTITAATANLPPLAHAGPDQAVAPGAVVTLDGSGSADPNGDALTYAWTLASRPEGSLASLSGAEGLAGPTFTADIEGTYVLELVVSDGAATSAPDSVIVTVARPNVAPVAAAGADGTGFAGRPIALDGRASEDADGDPLTFLWTFEARPEGSAATLGGADPAQPGFVPDLAGTYVVRLVVSDGRAESAPDTATYVVLPTFYDERFEGSDGGYVHAGPGDLWEWGEPVGWPGAYTGRCWGTNLDGDYVASSAATLTSPAIDLTAHAAGTPLRLIWRQAWAIESVNWDPATLTAVVDGVRSEVWRAAHTNQDWTELSVDLTFAAGKTVQLEWRLASDFSIQRRGLYVDDVMIAPGP